MANNGVGSAVNKFTDEILSEIDEIYGRLISKPLRENLFDIGYRLFLHFAYFGLLDGITPGIEQGAYSFERLEKELDEFYQYKSIYLTYFVRIFYSQVSKCFNKYAVKS